MYQINICLPRWTFRQGRNQTNLTRRVNKLDLVPRSFAFAQLVGKCLIFIWKCFVNSRASVDLWGLWRIHRRWHAYGQIKVMCAPLPISVGESSVSERSNKIGCIWWVLSSPDRDDSDAQGDLRWKVKGTYATWLARWYAIKKDDDTTDPI